MASTAVSLSRHTTSRLWQTRRYLSTSLSRAALPKVPLWIRGKAVETSSGGTEIHLHSQTRQEACQVVLAGQTETDLAIRDSQRAFVEWKAHSGWDRRAILTRVLSLLQERFDELAQALKHDVAVSDILIGADQRSASNLVDGASSTAIEIEGSIPQTLDNSLALIFREPFGPTLSIPAFNYPLTLALRSIVYPLACGNTVILKTPTHLPQLYSLFGPLFADAKLPPGCLQILNYSESTVSERVEHIISDPDVGLVNFTGSTSLGRILAAKCGQYLKPSIMELGGKSPAIVLPDADLELAANNILFGAFFNSGQVCMSTERCFVHSDISETFQQVLINAMTALESRSSHGFELVRQGAGEGMDTLVKDAISSGAQLIYPPEESPLNPSESKTSRRPLILSNIPSTSTLSKVESFSPMVALQEFTSTSDLISQVNQHETGLSSSIFTKEYATALDIARNIQAGAVHVNGMTIHDEHTLPFGGVKASGWGRFNGKGAIESFTWTKNVRLSMGHMLPLGAL
ncbi:putative aldehyde dehydrogenase [Naematelia encephala]|uniref:Putative aldehyde dehydrogenase n=1 Tax=Naematelia encephala TaxID=71784 RepID=A0A1Y2BFA0_9TREE|nr:putative aldehyde dehydrogenase [Naematelia encephala]